MVYLEKVCKMIKKYRPSVRSFSGKDIFGKNWGDMPISDEISSFKSSLFSYPSINAKSRSFWDRLFAENMLIL